MLNVSITSNATEYKKRPEPPEAGVEYPVHCENVVQKAMNDPGFQGVVLFEKTEVSAEGDKPDRKVWILHNPNRNHVPTCKEQVDKNLRYMMAVAVINNELDWNSWAFVPSYHTAPIYLDRAITEKDFE